jgi:hypothetical protein
VKKSFELRAASCEPFTLIKSSIREAEKAKSIKATRGAGRIGYLKNRSSMYL